ncbi:MAG: DUF418 domain-containing protein [Nibricoccus sp.]
MSKPLSAPPPRMDIVDALRGSALMGILLLHSIEHFDFYRFPKVSSEWLRMMDNGTKEVAQFLFMGKAYSLFAMMFGLSFFILLDRAAQRGENFRWRFLWRLTVLGIIGYVHSLLYCGDILSMLAVLGMPLVIYYGWSNRVLGWVSGLLLVQLPLVWQLVRLWLDSSYVPPPSHSGIYYREVVKVFAEQGFWDVIQVNAVKGNLAKWWWMIDNARVVQMLGLFGWGLLLGRKRIFEDKDRCVSFAKRAAVVAGLVFAILYYLELHIPGWAPAGPTRRLPLILVKSYAQLAQMVLWVSCFILLYHLTKVQRVLRLLIPYGRMSLTCYVTQALVWVPLYYNFGLGLFRQWGQFYSILSGAAFFVVQLAGAHWWLKRFHYGPLEWVWRSATLLSLKQPFRKQAPSVASSRPEPAPAAGGV